MGFLFYPVLIIHLIIFGICAMYIVREYISGSMAALNSGAKRSQPFHVSKIEIFTPFKITGRYTDPHRYPIEGL